jgi:hypothetical protein
MLWLLRRWLWPLNGNTFQCCLHHLEIIAVGTFDLQTDWESISFHQQAPLYSPFCEGPAGWVPSVLGLAGLLS